MVPKLDLLQEACGHYLSSWTGTKTGEEILEAVTKGNSEVEVWQPFENWSPEDLAEQIEVTAESLTNLYKKAFEHGKESATK